jgi:small nuclear ribonucleoprotein (snRNP)-like protein
MENLINNNHDDDRNESDGKALLSKWLNSSMKIKITDGRILIGIFLCTDRDQNIILGQCQEYITGIIIII